jgi:hypothetical protein
VLGSAIATPSSKPVIAERPSMLRIEADIRYPTPVNLVDDAVRTMVRLAGKALAAVPGVGADAERIVEQMVARGGEPREDRNTAGTVAATARLGREVPE